MITPEPLAMINPEIVWRGERPECSRGRLPLNPGDLRRGGTSERNPKVTFLDAGWRTPRSWTAMGLLATVVQHEIDHLDGVAVRRPPVAAEARSPGPQVPEVAAGEGARWFDARERRPNGHPSRRGHGRRPATSIRN